MITSEQLAAWKALAEKPHEVVRSNGTTRELDVALFKLGNEARTAVPALIAEVERLNGIIQAAQARGVVFSVMDFGAVGDGVHDDTEAFQAALDMVEEASRQVLDETYGTKED